MLPGVFRQFLVLLLFSAAVRAQDDAYARYVVAAPEFRAVRTVEPANWDTWIYMPWRHRWSVGTGDEGGRFCREHGINGGFLNYGRGPLAWLEKRQQRVYVEHVAGKGTLLNKVRGGPPDTSVRPVPLDAPASSAIQIHRGSAGRAAHRARRRGDRALPC